VETARSQTPICKVVREKILERIDSADPSFQREDLGS